MLAIAIHRQRGAAALSVTLVLFFVMTLLAAYANRNHVLEQRMSAHQYRAVQAFEAAEAGLEWAVAMLNSPRPIGTDCTPGHDTDSSFRERYLTTSASTGMQLPVTWLSSGVPAPLMAACVRHDSGWNCSCPASGDPLPEAPADIDPAPAFTVHLERAAQPGLVHLVAVGCSNLAVPCAAAESTADATARVQVTLGAVPGLAVAPVAPLTTRGTVNAGNAELELHNTDAAAGGIAVHAGGAFTAPHARLVSAPGGPLRTAVAELDTHLHALDGDSLFASFFGVDKAVWKQQPGVVALTCGSDCGDALRQATHRSQGHRLIWVEGELNLDGALALGSQEHPVIIVASGAVRLRGAVTIHGVVYGTNIAWNDAATPGSLLRGAAISEGDYTGNGAAHFIYDPVLLDTLRQRTGSFARLPGSWRDF